MVAAAVADALVPIRVRSPRRGASAPKRMRINPPYLPKTPTRDADLVALTLAHVKRQRRASKRRREVLAGGWGEAARQIALSATA
jgi:hypothetical protein